MQMNGMRRNDDATGTDARHQVKTVVSSLSFVQTVDI
jgi:hypothetical protein